MPPSCSPSHHHDPQPQCLSVTGTGLCLGHASVCYDVANRENAAWRRGRLLPNCAAGLIAWSGDGSVSVSSPDPSGGEGFAFAYSKADLRRE
jgi:hypothetical protein